MNRRHTDTATPEAAEAETPRFAVALLALALLVALGYQCFWAFQNIEDLTTRTVYEDAFYYFQTARAIAQGRGPVSSGDVLHDGYHPLWLLVCAGAFRVSQALCSAENVDVSAIRTILLLGSLLSLACAPLAFATVRRLGCGPVAAALAAAVLVLNPFFMSLATSGLEAPLNALLHLAVIAYLLKVGEGRMQAPGTVGGAVWLGALLGLLFLTRTDSVFFLLALGSFLCLRSRRDRRALGYLALTGVAAFLVVSPWFLYRLHRFGDLVQGSAYALPVVRRIVFFEANPGATGADFLLYRFGLLAGWFPALLYYSGLGSLWYLLAAGVAAALCTRRGRAEGYRLGFALRELLPLLIAVLCLGVAHKYLRLATREWYYVPGDVLLALVFGVFAHYFHRVAPGPRTRATAALLLVLGAAAFLGRKAARDASERLNRPEAYALEIVRAMHALPAEATPLGCTDSGGVGFLCDRPVINLDGVVNPAAARAIREGRLLDYAETQNIRHLVITPRMVNARILGSDYKQRLHPCPDLTPQGYTLAPAPEKPCSQAQTEQ